MATMPLRPVAMPLRPVLMPKPRFERFWLLAIATFLIYSLARMWH